MANWAYIENGEIVEKYDILPDNWKNISNFYMLKDNIELLKTLNWLPVIHPEYQFNPSTHKLDNPRFIVKDMTVIEEYDVVEIPKPQPPNFFEVQEMLVKGTQNRLDIFAQSRGYDNILSACSYKDDINTKFQKEGAYCFALRSETWSVLLALLEKIKNGSVPTPMQYVDIVNHLPKLEWPE